MAILMSRGPLDAVGVCLHLCERACAAHVGGAQLESLQLPDQHTTQQILPNFPHLWCLPNTHHHHYHHHHYYHHLISVQ